GMGTERRVRWRSVSHHERRRNTPRCRPGDYAAPRGRRNTLRAVRAAEYASLSIPPYGLVDDILEHLGQVRGLVLDLLVELLGRIGDGNRILRPDLGVDVRVLQDGHDVLIDLVDDVARHARRHHQAEPGIIDHIQAGLPEGRDVGQVGDAL